MSPCVSKGCLSPHFHGSAPDNYIPPTSCKPAKPHPSDLSRRMKRPSLPSNQAATQECFLFDKQSLCPSDFFSKKLHWHFVSADNIHSHMFSFHLHCCAKDTYGKKNRSCNAASVSRRPVVPASQIFAYDRSDPFVRHFSGCESLRTDPSVLLAQWLRNCLWCTGTLLLCDWYAFVLSNRRYGTYCSKYIPYTLHFEGFFRFYRFSSSLSHAHFYTQGESIRHKFSYIPTRKHKARRFFEPYMPALAQSHRFRFLCGSPRYCRFRIERLSACWPSVPPVPAQKSSCSPPVPTSPWWKAAALHHHPVCRFRLVQKIRQRHSFSALA